MKLRDRIKELRRVPASELLPNPKNWRTHPEAQQNALRGVLAEIGIADVIIVRETPHGLQIIDGHCRAEIAADAVVPVVVLDVDEKEADTLLAILDPIAGMAGQNSEALSALLKDCNEWETELHKLVHPDYVIDALLSAEWTPPEVEDMPESNSADKYKIGFSADQFEVVQTAIKKCRSTNDRGDELTNGQCVELICQHFLA